MTTTEARLGAIEDRFALEDLVSAYAQLVALGDGLRVAALFCDEGEFVGLGHSVRGREELLAFYVASSRPGAIVPMVTNMTFEISGGTALGRSTLAALSPGPRRLLCGAYEDDFIRTEDGWKFRRRRFTTWFET
jgi:hypothetical protein